MTLTRRPAENVLTLTNTRVYTYKYIYIYVHTHIYARLNRSLFSFVRNEGIFIAFTPLPPWLLFFFPTFVPRKNYRANKRSACLDRQRTRNDQRLRIFRAKLLLLFAWTDFEKIGREGRFGCRGMFRWGLYGINSRKNRNDAELSFPFRFREFFQDATNE